VDLAIRGVAPTIVVVHAISGVAPTTAAELAISGASPTTAAVHRTLLLVAPVPIRHCA
jgi:hypothetical protein